MKATHTIFISCLVNLIAVLLFPLLSTAQHTFSICAVDTATGQVGSAGATCITSSTVSAIIISDVHPGVGVVHTQASWIAANQNYARSLMDSGLTPKQIIDSVTTHDVQSNPLVRQYGVVSLDSGGLSAAYTGSNCMNYHNHITGPNYSIQGNILLGQQILDSMEARFLNTQGTLACKLMASLQGAKVIGADTRCTNYGISSYSAFIRVANTNDTTGNFLFDITINTYPSGIDPIDTLQTLFDAAGGCALSAIITPAPKTKIKTYPNPASENVFIETNKDLSSVDIINPQGIILKHWSSLTVKNFAADVNNLENGIYFLQLRFINGEFGTSKLIKN